MDLKTVVSHSEGDNLVTIRCADCNGHIVVLHLHPGCTVALSELEITSAFLDHPACCVARRSK